MRKRSHQILDDEPDDQNGGNQSGSNAMDTTPPGAPQTQLPWLVKINGRARYFCPILSCPYANLAQAKGWGGLAGVKSHLKEHTAGRFSGAIPQAFLDAHKLCSCGVCGKVITFRSGGTCPTCHPTRRAAISNIPTGSSGTANLPSLEEVCTARIRILKYVPRGVRPAWGRP